MGTLVEDRRASSGNDRPCTMVSHSEDTFEFMCFPQGQSFWMAFPKITTYQKVFKTC